MQQNSNVFIRELNEEICRSGDKISIITFNMQSLRGKFSEFVHLISSFAISFTFIVLTEVWLSDSINVNINLEGYNCKSCFRNEYGGGIIVYYRQNVTVNIDHNLTGIFVSHEALFINGKIPTFGDLIIWAIYRPPGCSANAFNLYLEDNLNYLNGKRCILVGDFNMNILKSNECSYVGNYVNILSSYGFVQCVDVPTYFSPTLTRPTTALDHIWHNLATNSNTYILYPPLSDHMGVATVLNVSLKLSRIAIKFRDYSFKNKTRFLECLQFESGLFEFLTGDAHLETKRFFNWIKYLMSKYFPLKTKYISEKRANAPWMTTDIMRCVYKKH